MSNTSIDTETIDIYLIGNDEEIAEGIKLIDFHFRKKIASLIERRAPSANPDDIFDIYQEVLLGIFKEAQEQKYKPGVASLEAYIFKIASNKTRDWLRKKLALKRNPEADREALVDFLAEAIQDSSIHEAWQYAHLNEARSAILKTIRNLIPKLKPRQRQVAEIMKENIPNILDDNEIRKIISINYDKGVTKLAVKSARQAVYKKIKEALMVNGNGDNIND